MRRIFHYLGITFFVLIVGIGGMVGYGTYRGSQLDGESKAYTEQAVAAIGRSWDKAELLKRASPALLKVASPETVATFFAHMSQLGKLVRCDVVTGEAIMRVGTGARVTAHYDAATTFANGTAHILIDLIKSGDGWLINGFHVNPVTHQMLPAQVKTI